MDAPVKVAVTEDHFLFLTAQRAFNLPVPPTMNNHGNYIISLGYFAKWLAAQAENLGVEIYPGFAAAEILYDESGRVVGVATGDVASARMACRPTGLLAASNCMPNRRFSRKAAAVR